MNIPKDLFAKLLFSNVKEDKIILASLIGEEHDDVFEAIWWECCFFHLSEEWFHEDTGSDILVEFIYQLGEIPGIHRGEIEKVDIILWRIIEEEFSEKIPFREILNELE